MWELGKAVIQLTFLIRMHKLLIIVIGSEWAKLYREG
jgi:hypothetical protein